MALVSFSPLTVPFNCPISKKFPEHAVTCSMPWKYGLGFLPNVQNLWPYEKSHDWNTICYEYEVPGT